VKGHRRQPTKLITAAWVAMLAAMGPNPQAQSLADVARAENARRKTIGRPGRIYTNKDLAPARVSPAPAAEPDAGTASAQADVDVEKADGKHRRGEGEDDRRGDEERWRSRMAAAREALERSRMFAEALQSRISALTADFTARDDPAARAVVAADREKAIGELARVRREIDEQQTAIVDLEEEARRARVPPGWLR
jgi:hypothetical protein